MLKTRLIARLDVKNGNVIKGVHLEGLRRCGDPNTLAKKYAEQGIDELVFIDVVASLYKRDALLDVVSKTCEDVFVPITVGGGLKSLDDMKAMLRAGADKVAVNTWFLSHPHLVAAAANKFGSQAVVVSIEAQRVGGAWQCMYNSGREATGYDVGAWASTATAAGAGEFLVTSVDQDGTRRGFDLELVTYLRTRTDRPIVASGGAGSGKDIVSVIKAGADAAAVGALLHLGGAEVQHLKWMMAVGGVNVRLAA